MPRDEFFEVFCATEYLKPYDLSLDEIQLGLLGGGNDGGIDAMYSFVDGEPLDSSTKPRRGGGNMRAELVVMQCKDSESFSGSAIDKIVASISALFDFNRSLSDLKKLYNEKLLVRVELFRAFYLGSIANIGEFSVHICYFSRSEHTHGALTAAIETLEQTCTRIFPTAVADVSLIGASGLLGLARQQRPEWLELRIKEGPMPIGDKGFVGAVSLSEYARFVTDERGNRRRSLFMDNVRDYEGNVVVNRAISTTLAERPPEDFWQLNNGVTIIAYQARPGYKALALQDPKIVNGLQSTMEIFEHFRRSPGEDDRSVLVRIVIPADEASQNRIIVATNSQTPITSGVLRATDAVHEDIEAYFLKYGLFYERRRNAYRNEGRSLESIVTIPFLARAVNAVMLRKPNVSVKVNAQSALLNNESRYRTIFSQDYPLGVYLNSALIMKRVDAFVTGSRMADGLPLDSDLYLGKKRRSAYWYVQWHLGMYVALKILGSTHPSADDLANMDISALQEVNLNQAAAQVWGVMLELATKRTPYQMAKSETSVERVLKLLTA